MTIIVGPYSNKDEAIKNFRLQKIADACNELMRCKKKALAISPLLYGISLIDNSSKKLTDNLDYWEEMCVNLVSKADEVYVLNLDGWDCSSGVKIEIERAKELNIPVYLIDFNTFEYIKVL